MNKMEALKKPGRINIKDTMFETTDGILKFTLCSKKIPHTDNSVGEKPAVSILLLQSE